MSNESTAAVVARIEEQIKGLKKTSDRIEEGIYGNGSKGLKARVVELETKFWVLVALFLSPGIIWGVIALVKGG